MTLSNPAPCSAVSISSAVAGSENRISQSVPPVKSMPSFRPEKINEMSPGTMTTSEMVNHSLRLLASLVIASETTRKPHSLQDSQQGSRHDYRREHADDDAYEERQGKPGDDRRASVGPEQVEDECRDHRRDIRITN